MNFLKAKSEPNIKFYYQKYSLDTELIPSNAWIANYINCPKTYLNLLPPDALPIIFSFLYGNKKLDHYKSYLNKAMNLPSASNILAIIPRKYDKAFNNIFLGFLYARGEHFKNHPETIKNDKSIIKEALIEPDDDITCLTQENEKHFDTT